jgi:hypothetical protein
MGRNDFGVWGRQETSGSSADGTFIPHGHGEAGIVLDMLHDKVYREDFLHVFLLANPPIMQPFPPNLFPSNICSCLCVVECKRRERRMRVRETR